MKCGWPALLASACAVALALVLLPPLPQPQDYHRFADVRAWMGVPNVLNLISNLPILLVAVAGLFIVRERFSARAESLPYTLFFLALAATAFGSSWYHLAPDNAHLFWDRLPIAVCFAMLLTAVITERIGVKAGLLLALPLAAAGAGSAWYWLLSEELGAGNVLPYFAFQLYVLLAILLLMHCAPSRYTRGENMYWMIALYGVALVAELLDRNVYAVGEFVSGHTLKHLLVALAAYQLAEMLHLRKRI